MTINDITRNAKRNAKAVGRDNINGVKDGLASKATEKAVVGLQNVMVKMGMSEEAAHSRFGQELAQLALPFVARMAADQFNGQISDNLHRIASHSARGNASRLTGEMVDEFSELIMFLGQVDLTDQENEAPAELTAEETSAESFFSHLREETTVS